MCAHARDWRKFEGARSGSAVDVIVLRARRGLWYEGGSGRGPG